MEPCLVTVGPGLRERTVVRTTMSPGARRFLLMGRGWFKYEKLKGDFIFKIFKHGPHGPHGPSVFGCPNLDPHLYDAKCVSDPGR